MLNEKKIFTKRISGRSETNLIDKIKLLLRIIKVVFNFNKINANKLKITDYIFSLSSINNGHNPFNNNEYLYFIDENFKFSFIPTSIKAFWKYKIIFKKNNFYFITFILSCIYFSIIIKNANDKKINFLGFSFLDEIYYLHILLFLEGYNIKFYQTSMIYCHGEDFIPCAEMHFDSSLSSISMNNMNKDIKYSYNKLSLLNNSRLTIYKIPMIFFSSGYHSRKKIKNYIYDYNYLKICSDQEVRVLKKLSSIIKELNLIFYISPHYFRGVENYKQSVDFYIKELKLDAIILKENEYKNFNQFFSINYGSNSFIEHLSKGIPSIIIEAPQERRNFLNTYPIKNYYISVKDLSLNSFSKIINNTVEDYFKPIKNENIKLIRKKR